MQLLSRSLGAGVAVAVLLALSALVATQSVARPLDATAFSPDDDHDHGDNRSLWSRDRDTINRSALRNQTGSATNSLAATTDIPFNRPPEAVAAWNREQLAEFPTTDDSSSVHPPGATLVDGRFIRDAYTAIFTVQPSTKARLTPNDQPRYVAPEGELFATLDYRVAVPRDSETATDRITWSLQSHDITDLQLLVDGRREAEQEGTRTPRFDYDLTEHPGTNHTLTVTANLTVELQRQHDYCTNLTSAGTCTAWATRTTTVTETITVRDSRSVSEYRLSVFGFYARYPNGDLGLAMFKTEPWLGYSLPEGRVNGVWRFYSARDPSWDRLVTSTATNTTTEHSPIHPLRVSAYPIKTGPTASPAETVSILEVNGQQREPPTLSPTVNLDVLEQSYRTSFSLMTRFETPDRTVSDVTAHGLVRGVQTDADPRMFEEVPIHRSNLTLAVLNTTARTATVRVSLRDIETGEPIETAASEGYVVLGDERVQTGADGTVTTTIDRPAGAIDARFEPTEWWLRQTGYVGDSDTVSVQGTVLSVVTSIYRAGVPVGLFLVAVFLIDRITGLPVWPPWRGL
ncbi:hypothetical protein [Halosimplex pelagicum]|uniref:Uncharacterized protein n=1 Tax=Halosimplex pelagicum TaxID=869886 RepID=A0A7D5P5D0_9EURY|nr:hypothetical protein [Halosimplex pelagicum]QLH81297.1 hypothetical protein HZS54_06485 [Halosimplex pelagicum]